MQCANVSTAVSNLSQVLHHLVLNNKSTVDFDRSRFHQLYSNLLLDYSVKLTFRGNVTRLT